MKIVFNNGQSVDITMEEALELSELIKSGSTWVNIWKDGQIAIMVNIKEIAFVK